MTFREASASQCSFDYDRTFPREFGGKYGDTIIKSFDFRYDVRTGKERLAFVGETSS